LLAGSTSEATDTKLYEVEGLTAPLALSLTPKTFPPSPPVSAGGYYDFNGSLFYAGLKLFIALRAY